MIYNKLSHKKKEKKVSAPDKDIEKLKNYEDIASFTEDPENKDSFEMNTVSEISFRSLFNMMSQGVIYQYQNGEIIMANPAAEKILRLTVSQMKGRTSHDPRWRTIHEDGSDFPGDQHPAMQALKTGKNVCNTIMGVYNPKKKNITWINVCAYPLFRNGEKKPYMVFTTFEDISARKKAEDDLAQSEKRYRKSIESAPYGVAVHDSKGNALIFNKELEKITGYSRDEIPDLQTWFKKVYPDSKYRDFIEKENKKRNSNNTPRITETVITCKDREKRTCQFVSSTSHSGIRTIFINDITEQKLIDEALSESEIRFRTVVENAADGIVMVDMDGRIMLTNSQMCKYSGYLKEELLSMNIAELDHEVISQDHRKKYWENLKYGEHVKFESVHTRKDKSTYPTEINIIKIMFREHPIILGFARDITERKRYETELHKAKEKAEESDRLKSAFLANMSHEIRTPLNGILGFADMLKNPELSDVKRKHFISIIQESGQHLLQIVNDIIDISKIEAKQIEINVSETSINDMLIELFTFYEPIARKNNINLYFQKNLTDAQAKVYTDDVKLKQVLQNLLSNAIKFTHKGYIKFGYMLKDNFLKFCVEDTGIGIDPDLHESIFERFRQGDINLNREYSGTGLGLSIAEAYVRKMGGKIWLSSEPSKGTIFYFTIPYKPAKGAEITKIRKKKARISTKSTTILVVEDDDVNYLYLEQILSGIKATILHARNAGEAIDIFSNNSEISLVLMDIKLPDMSGYKATEKIKQLNPEIPVIAQTAYALEGDREKALECGCDEYIAKPLKQDQLIELITKYNKKQAGS
jgi:PAS domain S-box-containing protein